MEKYDVAIIGGGSSGMAALKQLSKLGKQAILLEAGGKIGSKNISGGILYSKKPKKGKVTNVEDLYDNFLEDAPFERIPLVKFLEANNIQTRPLFTGNILRQPGFKNIKHKTSKGGYPITDGIMARGLLIGCHHGMQKEHLDKLTSTFTAFLEKYE